MTTSETIKAVCKDLKINQAELARRSGTTPSTLSRKLKNDTITMDEFRSYMSLLGVECDVKLTYDDGSEHISKGADEDAMQRIALLEAQLIAVSRDYAYRKKLSSEIRTAVENAEGCLALADKYRDNSEKVKSYNEKAFEAFREIEKNLALMLGENYIEESGASAPVDTSALKGTCVLIADDNALNREILREILEDNGIRTEEAVNGSEVLEKIENANPGHYFAVLMDMEMPFMDGCESTRRIRTLANRVRSGIPIIALTANALAEDRRRAAESGMDAFLTKPVNKNHLLRELVLYA